MSDDISNSPLSSSSCSLYKCAFCNENFDGNDVLQKHIRQVHIVPKSHAKSVLPKVQQQANSERKIYKCEFCTRSFGNEEHLKNHVKYIHENLKCRICGKCFKQNELLKEHIESVHERLKIYGCDVCGQLFNSQENAKMHKENVHEKQSSAIEQILIKTEDTNEIEMDSENS